MPRLSSLELPSLTPTVLAFFSAHGIISVEDFLVCDLYSLVSLAEHQQEPEQYKQAAADILSYLEDNHVQWCDGVELLSMLQQTTFILPTGCECLDTLLQGGLRDGTVTELVGSSSSGKTQVCMQTAARAILCGASVAYIDTCNSFSSCRISQMLCGLLASGNFQEQQDLERALKFVFCYRVYDIFSLLALLHQLDLSFSSNDKEKEGSIDPRNLRLLIVDSVSSVIAPILSNNQVQGHALMMNCGQTLRKLANNNSLSILVTVGCPSQRLERVGRQLPMCVCCFHGILPLTSVLFH